MMRLSVVSLMAALVLATAFAVPPFENVMDRLAHEKDLSWILELLNMSGLAAGLVQDGPFTVFGTYGSFSQFPTNNH